MSAASSEHQWFIAREGKQYGPVSDTELRKLLELGHLKGGDLVWRQGFADWQPAQILMPAAAPTPTPPAPQAAPAPQPTPAPSPAAPAGQPAPSTIRPSQNPQAGQPAAAVAPAPAPAPQPAAQPQPTAAPRDPARQELSSLSTARPSQRPAAGPAGAAGPATPQPSAAPGMGYVPPGQQQPQPQLQPQQAHPQQAPAHWPQGMAPASARGQQPTFGDVMRGGQQGPNSGMGAAPGMGPAPTLGAATTGMPGPQSGYPSPAAPYAPAPVPPGPSLGSAPTGGAPSTQPVPERRIRSSLETVSRSGDFDDEDEAPRKRGGAGKKVALALVVLALAGGGGYVLSQGGIDKVAQKLGNAGGAIAAAKSGGDAEARFAGGNLWPLVKKEFPEWYGERMKDVAKMAAEKKSDDAINKFVIEQLVLLRRQNADSALAASTPKLKDVATAFLANLKSLAGKSTDACYSFISQGEVSPAAIEVFRSPAGTPLEGQIKAIFDAISEGRKTRATHNPPVKSDYDVLADQLAKLGWGQTDLQLFADPRALAKAAPEKVCKMVQDWFTAHIAIPDAEVQERLLVETLRPVVAG